MGTDDKAALLALGTAPVIVAIATFSLSYPAETAATVGACALLALYVWWHVGTFRIIRESAHVPTTAADSPIIWTREGLIDFFQLNDSMTPETFHKFEAIIADLDKAPVSKPKLRIMAVAVTPVVASKPKLRIMAVAVKPRVRVKAGSRHIHATAENTAVQAPVLESATLPTESTHTHTTAADTAATAPRHGRYVPWGEYSAIAASMLIIAGIGTSNAVAGIALRATLAMVPYHLGWINADSFMSFGMSHLWKLI